MLTYVEREEKKRKKEIRWNADQVNNLMVLR